MAFKILKFFASLKLAVCVILSLAVVSAVGTITEAKYDSEVASALVYQSPYMIGVLGLLCLNLIGVMIDRWPWKKRHTGFIMAHIGIIMTLMGGLLTQKKGVDGTLAFEPGQKQRYVTVKNRDLSVYVSLDGAEVRPIFQREVDFLRNPPSEQKPFTIPVGQDRIDVLEYQHYAFRESEMLASERPQDGPAVRFQLENSRVNLTEWLKRETRKSFVALNLGPAQVVLSDGSYKPENSGNEIVLSPGPTGDSLRYAVYSKGVLSKRGVVKQTEVVDTGWMGLQFHVLRYLPRASERIKYQPGGPSPLAESALRIRFHGEDTWLGMNSLTRLYGSDRVYIMTFGHRRIPLDFELELKDFRIGKYQGTDRAASYESDVLVPSKGLVTISMNEPLKFGGYTFYQASYEQDPSGRFTSVLSVNYDPGRWLKYVGSLMVVAGSIILFWFRKLFTKVAQ